MVLLALLLRLLPLLPAPALWAADPPKQVNFAQYAQQITAATQLLEACERSAAACDAAALPPREQVVGAPAGGFTAGWEWLRDQVTAARSASPAERVRGMQAAKAQAAALLAEAAVAPPAAAEDTFHRARAAANKALRRDEFAAAAEARPSWLDRHIARLEDGVFRFFAGMNRLGQRAPWLAPAVEWGCFGLAAAALLWFVRQSLARQALRISLTEGAAPLGAARLQPTEWMRRAEEHAAASDWREAMHCLYWAAIALLEGRRAWKPSSTRTPREYLKLLRAGSEGHTALRQLTRALEVVWYGHDTADAEAFRAAQASFHALETARLDRAADAPREPVASAMPLAGGV